MSFSDKLTAAEVIPPLFFGTRFAPRPPQSLAASFRGAKSSQKFCAAICLRRLFQRRDLLPTPRKALRLRSGEQNLHRDFAPVRATGDSCWRRPSGKAIYHRRAPANRAPQILPGGRLCWRRPAGKALCHRWATPTGRPKFRLPADHVGAAPPAKPYITVGPRQQGAQAMMKKKKTADTYPS